MAEFKKDENIITGVRAALFDLDGTLFDSVDVWERIDVEYLEKRGFAPSDEYRNAISALGNLETARFSVRYFGLNETPEALAAEWTEMAISAYSEKIELLPGSYEYIEACKRDGIKIYAVTSLDKALALPCMKRNGIYGFFDGMITADETGLTKKSSAIYEHAAAVAGVSANACVVFDDVAAALSSAKSAGMLTVCILGSRGYYGAGTGGADVVVTSLADAPRLVTKN